jgi:galactosamine-6-phosphate isomerase
MNISHFPDYESMSQRGTELLMNELRTKKDLLVCAATGESPRELYERLAHNYRETPQLFDKLSILKLDEWGGIPLSDPHSCHSYLQNALVKPMNLSPDRFIAFDSEADNVENACQRIQQFIDARGHIDVCILGLGKNGHLGFNEPADFWQPDCHIAQLSTLTMQHNMVQSMVHNPTYGLTVGIKSIMQSTKIILLITGQHKKDAYNRLMSKRISTQLPASLLWVHAHVECLCRPNLS